MEDVKTLTELREELGICTDCGLHQGRTNIVFGAGAENADLLFVGEGPGRVEDAKGLPFVGPAGKLLDELLQGIDLNRGQVYIANVVKCRPPGNRDPLPDEIDKCNRYLVRQIELIRPKILCALGRVAAGVILNRSVQITKLHGQKFEGPGYFIVPVLHPAAALRSQQSMAMIREDFQNLRKYLDEDVSPPAPQAPEPEQMGLF